MQIQRIINVRSNQSYNQKTSDATIYSNPSFGISIKETSELKKLLRRRPMMKDLIDVSKGKLKEKYKHIGGKLKISPNTIEMDTKTKFGILRIEDEKIGLCLSSSGSEIIECVDDLKSINKLVKSLNKQNKINIILENADEELIHPPYDANLFINTTGSTKAECMGVIKMLANSFSTLPDKKNYSLHIKPTNILTHAEFGGVSGEQDYVNNLPGFEIKLVNRKGIESNSRELKPWDLNDAEMQFKECYSQLKNK